jgi:diguanylate cyclase (GGDEF)-like protein/PAS domain S-box-containing protein
VWLGETRLALTQTEQMRVVFDTLDRLSGARTTQGVVDILRDAARALAGADRAIVMLRDGGYVQFAGEASNGPVWEGRRFPLDECIGGWAILNRQAAVIEDVFSDSRFCAAACPNKLVKSMAVFPIRSADPIGALAIYWNQRGRSDPDSVSALQTLANAAAIAIENARLFSWVEVAYRSARQEARKYANLVNTVNGVVWEASPGTLHFTFVSEQAEDILGYPLTDWTASAGFWLDHVHADDRDWAADFRRRPAEPGDRRHFEYRMIAANGRTVWIADYVSVGMRSDNTACMHGVMVDITEQKTLERQLAWHALYDSLTSLPNRALFLDHAEKEVCRRDRPQRSPAAVLFLDLDRFKRVNDSLGHLAGDALLMAVASRLRKSSRESEMVARLSGDEFAILAPGAGHPDKARALAERIHSVFSRPFNVAGASLYLTASIGIAMGDGTTRSARDLLREADTAMYRAKNAGRARSEFFDASMHEHAVSRLRLESDLRRAVARREFELHYQPIVDINTHRVQGFEALLRWPHPERGLLPPSEFLQAAEDLGLMCDLGYDTITRVCATLRRWEDRGHDAPWISVNLSPVQLNDPDLLRRIRCALSENSLNPGSLKLEITEAGMVQTEPPVQERVQQLHGMGVGILIDDFGTGMSSFSRLLNAPVDTIKIDRRFIEEITTPDSSAPLLRSIISLARNVKVGLIAEGVESERQVLGLQELGCEAAQGFYFARPEPLDRAETFLSR